MKHILCYGDSNTFGTNPIHGGRHPEEVRWPCVMQKLLGAGYRVIEEGCGGRTTVWDDKIDLYRNGREGLVPCLASHNPLELLVLMLGTNDLKAQFHVTDWDLEKSMVQLIRTIKSYPYAPYYTQPDILIVSPVKIRKGIETGPYGCFDASAAERSESFARIYQKAADDNHCYFFDAASVAQASKEDFLHMDGENHRKLAVGLSEYIKTIL